MLIEDGDSILKYLQRISHPELKFGGGIQSGWHLLLKSGANGFLSHSEGCPLPRSFELSHSEQ